MLACAYDRVSFLPEPANEGHSLTLLSPVDATT
jgi:hypothetical protein